MKLVSSVFEKRSQIVLSVLFILLIPISLAFNSVAIDNKPKLELKPEQHPTPEVEVLNITAAQHSLMITSHGLVTPKYKLDLVSQVSGNLSAFSDGFEVGHSAIKGEVIASITPTVYEQRVAEAETLVEQAKVKVLEEQRKIQITKRDRANSAEQVDSPLVFGEPQLKAANAQLKSAKAQVKTAIEDLSHTKITLPFDAIITERFVSPGQYVTRGERVASIYASESLEIPLTLSPNQWGLLRDNHLLTNTLSATVSNRSGSKWHAKFTYVEQHIDTINRQRRIVFTLENGLDQKGRLLAGEFVSVAIKVNLPKPLLKLPASSITPEGKVWYVDKKEQLAYFPSEVYFKNKGNIYLLPVSASNDGFTDASSATAQRVLVNPSPNFLSGQKVKSIWAKG